VAGITQVDSFDREAQRLMQALDLLDNLAVQLPRS
jgi:hypothetical protein